ncbi:glycoside hydrolase family 2 protein [uncultured Fibrella sp.]|uniref:glycoside hydrolase family 2 protein n=1 Tax=uncultured Fibrella sp. TaxID=1284596 RepID=UPI0035CB5DCE
MLLRFILLLGVLLAVQPLFAQKTEIQYLSGSGKDHTVNWDFQCTRGRNSGKWTTIPVPSQWELHGFGTYQYGNSKEDSLEAGLYKHTFNVPTAWQQKRIFIVFDGSMTDTEVKINGQLAGPVHQGAYYQFRYEITPLLKIGQANQLEVRVSKLSANRSVNEAERGADFWVFGGIFRPVFLEAYPQQRIERTAIDAKANGSFSMNVFTDGIKTAGIVEARLFDKNGKAVGQPMTAQVNSGDSLVQLRGNVPSPALWTPEFPNLYRVQVRLTNKATVVHTLTERFGFRTVELRERDGIYVNGQRIMFRGVNRGTFWPTTGRTSNRELSLLDANLIKDMNMNAVRMSHYPPDRHFLDVCDSLGLFVVDELTGWQYPPYDTQVGRKLVKELITRDVNHPSIVLWANGNEGGFNFDLLPDYPKYDVQKRPIIHPWLNRLGTNTKHYINYNYGLGTFFNGHDVFFPTEFLHGLYDGGHGAGLDDFWNLMRSNPLSAGGFLWDFCDQGIVRTDKDGIIDTAGNSGADGIVGPYREKEASFYTIREIWASVFFPKKQITAQFNGQLPVENRFDQTNLNQCTFRWKLKRFTGLTAGDTTAISGKAAAPDIKPRSAGTLQLNLPAKWQDYDVLYLTANDPYGREINTWSWPISLPDRVAGRLMTTGTGTVTATEKGDQLTMAAGGVSLVINTRTGMLATVKNARNTISLTNGPVLIGGEATFKSLRQYDEGGAHSVDVSFDGAFRYNLVWTMYPSGWVKLAYRYRPNGVSLETPGVTFDYPEKRVRGMYLLGNGPYRVWRNRLKGGTINGWSKPYNDGVTGERWDYPEFKGYYANVYGARLQTDEGDFTVLSASEDLFLRVFTPSPPQKANNANTVPAFPAGGLSFLHDIPAIGGKFQTANLLGPQGQPSLTVANGAADTLQGVLYFDFR